MLYKAHRKHKNVLFLIAFVVLLIGGIVMISHLNKKAVERSTIDQYEGHIISGAFNKNKLKTDEEWKRVLTPQEFHILREAGTEIPFTGVLNNEKRKGTYYSIGCDVPLFRSEQKFDSGTGWPSFWAPINENAVVLRKEAGLGDDRIEVLDTCGGHLGHVFDDGPKPTGKRYCMNSNALRFVPDE